jgi:thiosulfate/3-mercaptopyruvate sulfurtransferase
LTERRCVDLSSERNIPLPDALHYRVPSAMPHPRYDVLLLLPKAEGCGPSAVAGPLTASPLSDDSPRPSRPEEGFFAFFALRGDFNNPDTTPIRTRRIELLLTIHELTAHPSPMPDYAHPEVLVSTDWAAEHLDDTDRVRFVEANEDVLLYKTGHLPNAVNVDWVQDLQDDTVRDFIDAEQFAALCSRMGIEEDTHVVFYGDKNNWWACYAFWVFKLYGHADCAVMDGGRKKWEQEGREMTTDSPDFAETDYPVPGSADSSIRAFRQEVEEHMRRGGPMVDVRSPEEFKGEITHVPGLPEESAMRPGHIPGARNVPWARAANDEDGTFRPPAELAEIYEDEEGLNAQDDTIAYCRIGERSSHTWFVLTYLLGFDQVKNYDGSWTEWGNLVGAPIETGEAGS